MLMVWTPEAVNDRESIYDYIESENPVAALKLDELFVESGHLFDEMNYTI